jgi:hypothetical protein
LINSTKFVIVLPKIGKSSKRKRLGIKRKKAGFYSTYEELKLFFSPPLNLCFYSAYEELKVSKAYKNSLRFCSTYSVEEKFN